MKENLLTSDFDSLITKANVTLIDTYLTVIRCQLVNISKADFDKQHRVLSQVKQCLSSIKSILDIK